MEKDKEPGHIHSCKSVCMFCGREICWKCAKSIDKNSLKIECYCGSFYYYTEQLWIKHKKTEL